MLSSRDYSLPSKPSFSFHHLPYESFGRVLKTAYGRLKNGWKPTLPPHSSYQELDEGQMFVQMFVFRTISYIRFDMTVSDHSFNGNVSFDDCGSILRISVHDCADKLLTMQPSLESL